jgi:hypothetical protein
MKTKHVHDMVQGMATDHLKRWAFATERKIRKNKHGGDSDMIMSEIIYELERRLGDTELHKFLRELENRNLAVTFSVKPRKAELAIPRVVSGEVQLVTITGYRLPVPLYNNNWFIAKSGRNKWRIYDVKSGYVAQDIFALNVHDAVGVAAGALREIVFRIGTEAFCKKLLRVSRFRRVRGARRCGFIPRKES